MKKIVARLALVAFAFLIPATASANDMNIKPYVGGGIGTYILGPGTGEDWVFGGYASIGAEVMPNLAFEVRGGTTSNGKKGVRTFGTDYFFSYLAKPQFMLEGTGINVYGLLGASTIKSWYKTTAAAAKVTKTVTSFSFGGGVEYSVSDTVRLGVEGLIMDSQDKSNRVPYNGNYVGSGVATVRLAF